MRRQVDRGPVIYALLDGGDFNEELGEAYAVACDILASSIKPPKSYPHAITGINQDLWILATQLEFKLLDKHKVWTPDWLPQGRRALDFRWVFAVKELEDGSLDKVRARITMKGFKQVEGVDFKETFSPVVKFGTIKAQLTVCAARDDEFYKVDVSAAYLYGTLDEPVYMKPPEGMDMQDQGDCLRLLNPRSQASRSCRFLRNARLHPVPIRCRFLFPQGARWIPIFSVCCC